SDLALTSCASQPSSTSYTDLCPVLVAARHLLRRPIPPVPGAAEARPGAGCESGEGCFDGRPLDRLSEQFFGGDVDVAGPHRSVGEFENGGDCVNYRPDSGRKRPQRLRILRCETAQSHLYGAQTG